MRGIAVKLKISIIFCDECTRLTGNSLEALHRILQDLCGNDKFQGGVDLLLSDFLQTLPDRLMNFMAKC